jgi:HD domain-containing protein
MTAVKSGEPRGARRAPRRLLSQRGEEIPLGARILTIVDSYDTMVSHRSYKNGPTVPIALAELDRCKGTQFDASLVEAFVRSLEAAASCRMAKCKKSINSLQPFASGRLKVPKPVFGVESDVLCGFLGSSWARSSGV